MNSISQRKFTIGFVLLALVVALVVVAIHSSHQHDRKHDATTCSLCVFQQSLGSSTISSVAEVLAPLLLLFLTIFFTFNRESVSHVFSANGSRAPPVL